MGMAASQARYLGLTARKTNVEYEGQQVNQQRTALANQSANLFNQLMTLQVPVPPSPSTYTTTQYSFTDGVNTYVVDEMDPLSGNATEDGKYNYMVDYHSNESVYTGYIKNLTKPVITLEGDQSGSTTTTGLTAAGLQALADAGTISSTPVAGTPVTYTDASGNTVTLEVNDGSIPTITNPPFGYFSTTTVPASDGSYYVNGHKTYSYDEDRDKKALNQIAVDLPTSAIAIAYNAGQTANIRSFIGGDGERYYTLDSQLAASMADPNVQLPIAYASDTTQEIKGQSKAYIEKNDSGRLTTISLKDFEDKEFSLHAETTTDDVAYEDAMNQYSYDINVYEKAVQDINAKTEIIQQEDRTLELRLKQLDTEQEALSTEMDAVKKVIDKNIEQTFKTFA